jgi:hypothetical protein
MEKQNDNTPIEEIIPPVEGQQADAVEPAKPVEPTPPRVDDDGVIRINLDEGPKVPATPKGDNGNEGGPKPKEEGADDKPDLSEGAVLEEIVNDDPPADPPAQDDPPADPPKPEYPENIQKLVDFINDTGGTVEDYVALNKDYSNVDETQLLRDYYKNTNPDYTDEELDFVMEDKFSYDEDMDEERDIKRKQLAKKAEVKKAREHLESLKTKYYDEIKAGSKLTPDQKKAIDFFNRYEKESSEKEQTTVKQREVFNQKTEKLFSQDFKGFEYKVGEKVYRYNVKDPITVKQQQSDINNFTKKFLGDDKTLKDEKGYHKSLFTAMNADAIANHFYQQGKADAIKESIKTAKNIDMDPRGTHTYKPPTDGKFKARVVDEPTQKFKFKP